MSVDQTKKQIEVMQAYIDCKPIECREKGTDAWLFPAEISEWNFEHVEYRVRQKDKYRDEQILSLDIALHIKQNVSGQDLYDAGCRILAPEERIVKPLTDEQRAVIRSIGRNASVPYVIHNDAIEKIIDAVERKLKVID